MHAACKQVLLGAYPELLVATNPQSSCRNSDCLADFRDVQWSAKMFCNQFLESPHNALVAPQVVAEPLHP